MIQNNPNYGKRVSSLWNIHCKLAPDPTLTSISPRSHLLSELLQQPPISFPAFSLPTFKLLPVSSRRIWCHPSHSKPFHLCSIPARSEPNSEGWFQAFLNLAVWTSLQPHFLLLSRSSKHCMVQVHQIVSAPTATQHVPVCMPLLSRSLPRVPFLFFPIARPCPSLENQL